MHSFACCQCLFLLSSLEWYSNTNHDILVQIKKFKDALTKYGADCCSLEPVKGLEEKELLALAANKDLSFAYTPKTEEPVPVALQEVMVIKTSRTSSSCPNTFSPLPLPLPLPLASTSHKAKQDSKSEVC
ncbi:hypothetical protein AABB24_017877 [Solanum stoloniferum]|uniref:Uncharacterized protein n=1 Tax=Solanum stoloniferum TaxID=62892 RepID=A0ABD2TLX5_9SOLN